MSITEDSVHRACKHYARTERRVPRFLAVNPWDWSVIHDGVLRHCLDDSDHIRIGRYRLLPYLLDTLPLGVVVVGADIIKAHMVPIKSRRATCHVDVIRGEQ